MKPVTVSYQAEAGPRIAGALAALCLSTVLPALGTSIATVALPTLAQDFDAGFAGVQWVVLAYLLAVTTLVVGAGRLGDIAGRRRLLLAGIVGFTVASALCALAPTLGWLIAARAGQGLGAAVMTALAMALVSDLVPAEKAGRAMGLLATMSAIGTALGPSLGGLLIASYGWRAIFLVNLPLGLLAYLLARHALPADPPRATRAGFDRLGTLLLALALGAYALAMTGRFDASGIGLLAVAATAAALFARVEARSASPLIAWETLRPPALRSGLAIGALVASVMMATLVVGPFHLSRSLGLDAARVGLVVSVGPLVTALSGVPAGRIADRFGTRAARIAGLIGMGTGCGLLALLPATLSFYLGPIVVITVGYALVQTANTVAVMTQALPDQRGAVSGLLNLSRNLGLISGASVMGAVFAAASATGGETEATGLRTTFAVATMLIIVALVITMANGPSHKSARRAPF
jgi:EmrB/QacA subfamily drug resistance transporter